jgi:riboflavin kinase/FMN adenylyltransferase
LSQGRSPVKSIAIGSFDGIHVAHRHLIDQADGVVVIERGAGYLTPGFKRSDHTDKPLYFYFLDTIKELGAAQFIERLKSDFPALEKIVVGYDFHFGQGREGDAEHLRELFDREVIIVDEVKIDGISVHSRVIQEYLQKGNLQAADIFLGRRYSIDGEVISGQGIGAKELVPTINLKVLDYQLPMDGVYSTRTQANGIWHDSVSFIGHRISTDGSFAVETHVIDQKVDKPSGEVRIEFASRLRDNMRFDSLKQLKDQIHQDIHNAKNLKV